MSRSRCSCAVRSPAARSSRGDRLPAAKDLAAATGVDVHTVLRAYGELRDAGLIDLLTAPRCGGQSEGTATRRSPGPGARGRGGSSSSRSHRQGDHGQPSAANSEPRVAERIAASCAIFLRSGHQHDECKTARWKTGGARTVAGTCNQGGACGSLPVTAATASPPNAFVGVNTPIFTPLLSRGRKRDALARLREGVAAGAHRTRRRACSCRLQT